MWTTENRWRYNRSKLRYPSDLTEALCQWRLSGPDIPASLEKHHGAREHRDRQALRHSEEVRRVAEAMDRRAHIRVAGATSQARQGLGEFQFESARAGLLQFNSAQQLQYVPQKLAGHSFSDDRVPSYLGG